MESNLASADAVSFKDDSQRSVLLTLFDVGKKGLEVVHEVTHTVCYASGGQHEDALLVFLVLGPDFGRLVDVHGIGLALALVLSF